MNIDRMVAQWEELIKVADNTAAFRPESGFLLRNMFHRIVFTAQNEAVKLDATELLGMMEGVTEQLTRSEDDIFVGQLMLLTTLLAIYYPATMGMCARGYECAAKTLQANRQVSPN